MSILNPERLPRNIVTIGASAGGIAAVRTLLSLLPPELPAALVIVVHRSPMFVSRLAAVFGRSAYSRVVEPADGDPVTAGSVYLAPADAHLLIEKGFFRLRRTPKVHFTRPAIDPLFRSAATTYGARVVGVLLSGGGNDGTSGLIAIKGAGGVSIVQHPGEAQHPFMPTQAILYDDVDAILPLKLLAQTLVALAAGESIVHPAESLLRGEQERLADRQHVLHDALLREFDRRRARADASGEQSAYAQADASDEVFEGALSKEPLTP